MPTGSTSRLIQELDPKDLQQPQFGQQLEAIALLLGPIIKMVETVYAGPAA